MNRTQQLKLLNDEIRRLFSEGVSEQDAFVQLSTDQRFESVRRTSVQSLYKKLQKDIDKEAQKRWLEERRRKLHKERKRMFQYRQSAKNLLLYEDLSINKNRYTMDVWQNRYLVTVQKRQQSNDTRELNVQDLYQNISKKIYFSSTNVIWGIHYLSNSFVLIDESHLSSFFRLARIDLVDSSLQFIQTIDRYRYSHLVIDSSNPSKFLLVPNDGFNTVVLCKLVDGKIEVEPEIELENVNYFADTDTYFNGQLLMFRIYQRSQDWINPSIIVQDLDTEKKSKTLKLEELPSNIYNGYVEANVWLGNHFFRSIQFCLTNNYGIAFTNPSTCKWSILEFSIDASIGKILVDNNQDLLVWSQERLPESHEYLLKNIYKLPMRKPELLRYKAWTKTVMLFKKKQAADPYEEARKYLPLNSDIRGIFAADQIDDE